MPAAPSAASAAAAASVAPATSSTVRVLAAAAAVSAPARWVVAMGWPEAPGIIPGAAGGGARGGSFGNGQVGGSGGGSGGGGGGLTSSVYGDSGGGGGGGVGGKLGFGQSEGGGFGGTGGGGFGGGGGGSGLSGGVGGFGGGGGSGLSFGAGGGFGGGGGGSFGGRSNNTGGFGAGAGNSGGGGGLGAGGDIFVQQGGSLTIEGGSLTGGTVTGGAGAGNAGDGSALGSGIFLQGDQSITLAPPANQTMNIDDVIADQSGSGGIETTAGTGALGVNGLGTVVLGATNTFTGGITVNQGTIELAAAGAAGSGAITFAGSSNGALVLDAAALPAGGTFANMIVGFGPGDALDLRGLTWDPTSHSASFDPTTDMLTVTSGAISDTLTLNGVASAPSSRWSATRMAAPRLQRPPIASLARPRSTPRSRRSTLAVRMRRRTPPTRSTSPGRSI